MSDDKKTLNDAIDALGQSVPPILHYFTALSPDDLNGHLAGYKQLREGLDQIEAFIKILAQLERELTEKTLPELFERHGIEGIKLFGRNFIPASRMFASIPAEKRAAGFAWLKAHGMGHLIQDNVNAQKLSSELTDYIQETAVGPPEEAISIHVKKYIQMRKT